MLSLPELHKYIVLYEQSLTWGLRHFVSVFTVSFYLKQNKIIYKIFNLVTANRKFLLKQAKLPLKHFFEAAKCQTCGVK